MKKPKNFDVKAWAATARALPTRVCATCGGPWAEAIEEAEALRRAGKAHYTQAGLLRMLKEQFDYPYADNALRNHLKNCVGKTKQGR